MAGDYRVSPSGSAMEELDRVLAEARRRGIFPRTRASAAWLLSELEWTPMAIGESREYFPHLRLYQRFAVTRPVSVWYAVHEESRTVFVQHFGLTGL